MQYAKLFKPFVTVSLTAVMLAACGTQKSVVTSASHNTGGVECAADIAETTRLVTELQHCLVNEAIADFLKRPPTSSSAIVIMLNQRAISNETDQTTVDAYALSDYIRRQLDIKANIKTATDFQFGNPTHALEVTIRGQRVRGNRGAVQVTYTLTFELKDLNGNVVGTYLGDIKVERGRRSTL